VLLDKFAGFVIVVNYWSAVPGLQQLFLEEGHCTAQTLVMCERREHVDLNASEDVCCFSVLLI
jgi:hypothetical protein